MGGRDFTQNIVILFLRINDCFGPYEVLSRLTNRKDYGSFLKTSFLLPIIYKTVS